MAKNTMAFVFVKQYSRDRDQNFSAMGVLMV